MKMTGRFSWGLVVTGSPVPLSSLLLSGYVRGLVREGRFMVLLQSGLVETFPQGSMHIPPRAKAWSGFVPLLRISTTQLNEARWPRECRNTSRGGIAL